MSASVEGIQAELKRDAVHWAWQVAMLACAGMVLWFVLSPMFEWAGQRASEQAAISSYPILR